MDNKEFFEVPRKNFINKTLKWSLTDNEENYHIARKKHNIVYGLDDIEYNYNNKGFRCDDFDSWGNHPFRVLFAGCSFTEATALPIEAGWAKTMHSLICNKFNITMPFWSIAAGGTGLDQMSRYLYHIGDTLRPQIVISSLPDTTRRERWNDDVWSVWSFDSAESKLTKDKSAGIFIDDRFINYQIEKNFAFMDTLLDRWNSEFVFVYNTDLHNLDISYMDLKRFTQIKKFQSNSDEWDYGRDGIHAGPNVNRLFAERYFNLIEPKIKEKLGL